MAVIPSQVPQRIPAGAITDPPYGPWADIGTPNPFFYHLFSDDFDNALGSTGLWTVTSSGTGSVVHTPGDGGQALFTTGATGTNFESIQLPAASFTLPQGALAGKKMGYLFRMIGMSDVVNSAFINGLCQTTTTPFAAITDGIYFAKASASSQITLNIAAASSTFTYNIPQSHYTLANNTQIDFSWTIDRYGNVLASIGSTLVGWIPQSGTGASVGTNVYPKLPVLCPTEKIYSGNQPTTVATGVFTLTTANLNATVALQTGAAAAKTMTVDFIGVAKER